MTSFLRIPGWVLVGLAGVAQAQVAVQLELDQEQYIAREPIVVAVRIINRSGVTLHLGEHQDWLSFDVEAVNGDFVPRIGEAPVVRPFELPNVARGTRWVDIAPYFDLRNVGRYKVVATVRIRELNQEVTSKPAYFNLISGATIWEQPFGWRPVIDGRPREIQFRRYALVNVMDGKHVMLYARLSDRYETQVLRVMRLGRLLTFSRPAARIDQQSRLHVLWQTGAKVFSYVVLNPELKLVLRQTHQYTDTRPHLRVLPDGQIKVVGGARIANSTDYPPAKEEEPAAVAETNAVPALPAASLAPNPAALQPDRPAPARVPPAAAGTNTANRPAAPPKNPPPAAR
jgi:hypothetical protein